MLFSANPLPQYSHPQICRIAWITKSRSVHFAFFLSPPILPSFFPPFSTSRCPAFSASVFSVMAVRPEACFFAIFCCRMSFAFLGFMTRAPRLGPSACGLKEVFKSATVEGKWEMHHEPFGISRFVRFFDCTLSHRNNHRGICEPNTRREDDMPYGKVRFRERPSSAWLKRRIS